MFSFLRDSFPPLVCWRTEDAPLKSERLFRLPAMETYKTCGNPYGFPKPMFFFASLTPFFPLPATSQWDCPGWVRETNVLPFFRLGSRKHSARHRASAPAEFHQANL